MKKTFISHFTPSSEEKISSKEAWQDVLKGVLFASMPHMALGDASLWLKEHYTNASLSEKRTQDISYKEFNADLKSMLKAREILAKYSEKAADRFMENYLTFAIESLVAAKVESIIEAKVEEYMNKRIESQSKNEK